MADLGRRSVLLWGVAMGTGRPLAELTAWDFAFPSLEGGTLDLATFRRRVLLVANTASFCGYTYQYEQLEKLHRDFAGRGLTVVGVPSQDFNQEKDSNAEVKQFCEATFGVDFPMAGLTHVRGAAAHAFYAWVRARRGWEPDWNFNKVLIGRDGQVHGTFRAADEPYGAAVQSAIGAQLAAS